jgi:hypothetical protein
MRKRFKVLLYVAPSIGVSARFHETPAIGAKAAEWIAGIQEAEE